MGKVAGTEVHLGDSSLQGDYVRETGHRPKLLAFIRLMSKADFSKISILADIFVLFASESQTWGAKTVMFIVPLRLQQLGPHRHTLKCSAIV